MMLSAWCLVASGQWLVASAVLPTLGVRAPYVGGSGSLRWGFGLPTLGVRAPYVGGTLSLRWRGALSDRALRTGRGRPPGGPEVGRTLWVSRSGSAGRLAPPCGALPSRGVWAALTGKQRTCDGVPAHDRSRPRTPRPDERRQVQGDDVQGHRIRRTPLEYQDPPHGARRIFVKAQFS